MNRRFHFYRIPIIFFLLFLSACGGLFLKMYGMKKYHAVDTQEIKKYATKFRIPANASFELDTSSYLAFLKTIDTTEYPGAGKNHAQPLQVMYYNEDGVPVCWYINCYAGGFPNLKWDRDSAFARFPPKQQTPLDSLLMLRELYGMIKPINNSVRPNTSDTTIVVVFWNRWMGRQSERLIEIVQKNAAGHNASIIYVNNDNFFCSLE